MFPGSLPLKMTKLEWGERVAFGKGDIQIDKDYDVENDNICIFWLLE